MKAKDKEIVRALAQQYHAFCMSEQNQERRRLWTAHNSKEETRPLLLVGIAMYNQLYAQMDADLVVDAVTEKKLLCTDPVARQVEKALRWKLYHISLKDDTVFEPYLLYKAVRTPTDENRWGASIAAWAKRRGRTAPPHISPASCRKAT